MYFIDYSARDQQGAQWDRLSSKTKGKAAKAQGIPIVPSGWPQEYLYYRRNGFSEMRYLPSSNKIIPARLDCGHNTAESDQGCAVVDEPSGAADVRGATSSRIISAVKMVRR
jgi:hypothetical protein